MKLFLKYLLTPILVAFSLSSFSQSFSIHPTPSWVKEINPEINSTFSKYDINNGVYTSLIDHQVNLILETDFTHFKLNIVSDAGISLASELKLVYDSSYQKVNFHYLYIWRNGKKIDRTSELSFEMMNNEQDVQFSIYTGAITAYEILEDVRKGDIVEYAYSIIGENPIFKGFGYRIVPLEDTNPIDYFNLRITYDNSQDFDYTCVNCESENIDTITNDKTTTLNYLNKDIVAFEIEETVPSWLTPYKHFVIGNYKTWQNVNNWAEKLFRTERPEDENLSVAKEEIFQEGFSIEDKINAAINYVQNDIRYLGLENGIGSFKPFPPSKVVEQRYGDCKDKSLLLVTLLRQIGVNNSYPALVNADILRGVENYLPGGQLFNHVIVYFEYEDEKYWIDPTIPFQGGLFKNKSTPNYEKALIVKEGTTDLTDMNIDDKYSRTEIVEKFTITSYDNPGVIEVTTKLYGYKADYYRAVFEYYSIKEVSDNFKSAYGILFPNIETVERLKITDDSDKNIITLVETYNIENFWNSVDENGVTLTTFKYEPISIYNYISPMVCEKKKYPIGVPYPSKIKQYTVIELPEKIKSEPSLKSFSNSAFNFTYSTSLQAGKTVKLTYEFYTKTTDIPANEFKPVCEDLNKINVLLPVTIYYGK